VAKTFSIRNPLQGELIDFLKSSGFECTRTTELVRDLTCLLASYREEDVSLFPDVFVLPNVNAVAPLSPGTERVVLGSAPMSTGADAILKNCASLAVRGWAIYVAKTTDNAAEYGVFRSLVHSFALSADQTMADDAESSPAVLIRNRGRLVVELSNAKRETFTAAFTSAPASVPVFASHVATFVEAATSTQPGDGAASVRQYLVRLLTDILQHCHGALLAAHVAPDDGIAPATLSDGVWLKTPIDFSSTYRAAVEANNAQSLASLQAFEALLTGMIASDGVVVFGTNSTVLGYRIFLKPTEEEKKALPDRGGGRRRTYSLMSRRLGPQLRGALFRSQDGDTECEKAS
jgi:hypothetical protein